jgi:aspartate/methionine/tyrosine aminotransferase
MTNFDSVDLEFLRKRAALKWGRWREDVISLSVADLDFKAPDEIKEAVVRAAREDRTPYGAYGGDPDVVEAVCDKLRRVNRIPAKPEHVHMIPGTMFAIFMSCYYFLRPGDEAILCPSPVYPPFIHNILNARALPVFNPLDFRNDLKLDIDDLKRRITPRTRMLMVSNPHNPTGRVFTTKELEGIAEVARKYDLLIFADELYEDMLFEGDHVSLASLSDDLFRRTLTVFGFSKAFGIPGYRIAYIVSGGSFAGGLKKRIHDIIVHADTLAQAAAKAALLTGSPWISSLMAHLKAMRNYSLERLSRIPGIWCPAPQGTPFLFPDVSGLGMTGKEFSEYLKEKAKVIVMDGAEFGPPGENHIRINFATSHHVLSEAFDRIEEAVSALPMRKK